jgi:DNA-binding response OmpR family regulator
MEGLRRILIVEDEIAIGLEIEARLRDAGFAPVGPAIDAAEASAIIAGGEIDAAVLDVGVFGGAIDAAIDPLRQRQVPLVFMTGYDAHVLPPWIEEADRFGKPFSIPDLIDRLKTALARSSQPA